MDVERIE